MRSQYGSLPYCRTWRVKNSIETSFSGSACRIEGQRHRQTPSQHRKSREPAPDYAAGKTAADLKKEKGAIAVVGCEDSSTSSSETELRLAAEFLQMMAEPVFCPYWHWVNLTTG